MFSLPSLAHHMSVAEDKSVHRYFVFTFLVLFALLPSLSMGQIALGPVVGTTFVDNSDYEDMPFVGLQASIALRSQLRLVIEYFTHGSTLKYGDTVLTPPNPHLGYKETRKSRHMAIGILTRLPTNIKSPQAFFGAYIGHRRRDENVEHIHVAGAEHLRKDGFFYYERYQSPLFMPVLMFLHKWGRLETAIETRYSYAFSRIRSKHSMQLLASFRLSLRE